MLQKTGAILTRFRYLGAVVLGLLALAVSWFLYPLFDNTILTIFYVVVVIVAWRGGLGPAIVSMIISVVALVPLLVPPLGDPGISTHDVWHVVAFLAVSVVIALITASHEKLNEALRESLEAERRTEARNVAMMDSVAEALVLVAPDQRVLGVNDRFERLLGVPPDQAVGKRFAELQGEPNPILDQVFAQPQELVELVASTALDSKRYFTEVVVQNWPKARELELFSAPVCSGDCNAAEGGAAAQTEVHYGRLYVFRDVTHEREVDRMKTEFVSLVSHELRTPLTSIKGFTDMILDGDAGEINEEVEEFLEIVQSNANRLVLLVNDLLDISRIESGRIQLKIAAVDLGQVIDGVVAVLKPQIEAKEQTLAVEVEPAAAWVMGDRDKLVQVVTNYLSNAYKYTPAGGDIRVEAKRKGDFCRLAVVDDGIGIAPEDQQKLFTRFYRVDSSMTAEIGGTGLGLSIVKKVIELHGGWVGVQSEEGKGSTFFFTVPLAQEIPAASAPAAPAPVQEAAPIEAGVPGPPERNTILVVEDEEEVVLLLRDSLEQAGYIVDVAASGEMASDYVARQAPDLIMLDHELPGMDGLDLAARLAQAAGTRDIPILLISVLDDDPQNLRLGVNALPKPIDRDQLLHTVAQSLEASARQRILIVEDDPDIRELLKTALGKRGLEVQLAEDGETGLALARRDQPGLILLDLRLPGMDGFAVLQALKHEPSTAAVPVITMTGSEGLKADARARVLALGGADLVAKPFDLNMLIEEIRIFIQQQEV